MATQDSLQFADGNVEIHFSKTDKIFVLHSHVLALHSPWFKAALSERWNGNGEATTLNGKNHWVYELRFDKNDSDGLLMRKPSSDDQVSKTTEFSEGSEFAPPFGTRKTERELHMDRVKCIRAHRDLLGALYHVPTNLASHTISYAEDLIKKMMHIAVVYDCERIAKVYIESHLSTRREAVLEICSSSPLRILELAMHLECGWIFQEAATNLLGRSNRFYEDAEEPLADLDLTELMDEKRRAFVSKLKECELEMFQIQPAISKKHAWVTYHAVAFFREWLANRVGRGQGSGLAPGYANLYHVIVREKVGMLGLRTNEIKD